MKKLLAKILSWFRRAAPELSLPEQAEEAVRRFTEEELRARWASRHQWCADNAGRGYRRPTRALSPGWFWKRDIVGRVYRVYRVPV